MYYWQIRHVNTLADKNYLMAYTLQIINHKETPGVRIQTEHLKRFKDALLKKPFDRTNESSCNNFSYRHQWQHLLFTDLFWEDSLNKQVWTRLFQFKECLVSFFLPCFIEFHVFIANRVGSDQMPERGVCSKSTLFINVLFMGRQVF